MTRPWLDRLQAIEFEGRIFVSFSLVSAVCLLSFFVFDGNVTSAVWIGSRLGLPAELTMRVACGVAAALTLAASLLRIWAGSVLSSDRMMAFKVQHDELVTRGPYRLVRNPIYSADLLAFGAFALCLRPVGLLLPLLLYLHYLALTSYEEHALSAQLGTRYTRYAERVPRFVPRTASFRMLGAALGEFAVTGDGLRHNALYLFFVPGFVVSACTQSLLPALLIGLPAVFDWAIVHTLKRNRRQLASRDDFSFRVQTSRGASKVASDILYAQCWEDPEMDRVALGIAPGDTVFTITSGGCNALAFLLDDPARVIALDLNPQQKYLLELKMAGFRALDYQELLAFLGVDDSPHRLHLYRRLRSHLEAESRAYWDRNQGKLERGVLHCGRYEAYLGLMRRWFYRLLDGKGLADALYAAEQRGERERIYSQRWDGWRWRAFTRLMLSRTVQSRLFDPVFFAQLDATFSFGAHFRERVRHAVVELPLRENPFLCYVLFGRFRGALSLPTYLRRENFELIRARLDRLECVVGSCESHLLTLPENAISNFNFTNIFEWMTPEGYAALLRETIRVACDGARITYRNLLVSRSRPESLRALLIPERELARRLHASDRSFIYRDYVVERVRKS